MKTKRKRNKLITLYKNFHQLNKLISNKKTHNIRSKKNLFQKNILNLPKQANNQVFKPNRRLHAIHQSLKKIFDQIWTFTINSKHREFFHKNRVNKWIRA